MTVDELLAKLDAEYDKLESELPEHFLAYGRFKYPILRIRANRVISTR